MLKNQYTKQNNKNYLIGSEKTIEKVCELCAIASYFRENLNPFKNGRKIGK